MRVSSSGGWDMGEASFIIEKAVCMMVCGSKVKWTGLAVCTMILASWLTKEIGKTIVLKERGYFSIKALKSYRKSLITGTLMVLANVGNILKAVLKMMGSKIKGSSCYRMGSALLAILGRIKLMGWGSSCVGQGEWWGGMEREQADSRILIINIYLFAPMKTIISITRCRACRNATGLESTNGYDSMSVYLCFIFQQLFYPIPSWLDTTLMANSIMML